MEKRWTFFEVFNVSVLGVVSGDDAPPQRTRDVGAEKTERRALCDL